jgi:hypothetical protein
MPIAVRAITAENRTARIALPPEVEIMMSVIVPGSEL